jgi:hypothetical protein
VLPDFFVLLRHHREESIQGTVGHMLIQIKAKAFHKGHAADLLIQFLVVLCGSHFCHGIVRDGPEDPVTPGISLVSEIADSLIFPAFQDFSGICKIQKELFLL